MIRNTKNGRTPFKSKRHGKTRRVQRGGAPKPVIDDDGNQVGEYDDTTGKGRAVYPEVGVYVGHFNENGVPHGHGTLTYDDESVYEGEWVHNSLNGRGKMTYSDGDVYEGEWLNNRMHGRGIIMYKDIGVYEGDWQNGLRNGRGTITYYDGHVYEGEWADDKKNGRGEMTYANGDVYEGEWADDKKNGRGEMTYANGDVYEGQWANDKKNGRGEMTYANGDVYEGQWANDKKNGHGKMTYANGDVYEGNWLNNNMHDVNGRYTKHADGKVQVGNWINHDMHGVGLYEGELNEDGLANGRGKCTFINDDVYEGMWEANCMHGQGILTYHNKDVYEGPWHYDQRHGIDGIMTYAADKSVYEGEWWNDNMHGNGVMTDANGSVIYEGLWRENEQNPLFDPATGELADNTEYNATLATRPAKIFSISDNMLYKTDTYKYYYQDLMDLLDRLVLEALEEDPDAIALKVNRTYYVVSIRDIVRVANNNNFIQYECPILVDLDVNQADLERVIKAEPYLSINGMGVQLGGVVNLFDIWSAIKSGYRAFELVGTRRVLLSTASHNTMFRYGDLVSSNHCQSGTPATVYEMRRLRREDAPTIKRRKQYTIKNKGTKKLKHVVNLMRGVQKQSHARTQSHRH